MAQDVTNLWNTNAANFNFETTGGASAATTFADVHSGLDLNGDLANILKEIDKTARPDATNPPPIMGDDFLLARLENYPDNP
jgi:hypothetical protein